MCHTYKISRLLLFFFLSITILPYFRKHLTDSMFFKVGLLLSLKEGFTVFELTSLSS